MVASRALRASATATATACASCRLSIIRSFTSLAGPSIRAPQVHARSVRCSRSSQQIRLSSQLVYDGQATADGERNVTSNEFEELEKGEEEDVMEEGRKLDDQGEESQVSALPWYLQVESPQRAPKQLSERQRLPDLPDAAPPILQPLMQQISVDLGLDDLALLDLRKLDPPPALGANLFMILGTARSERHLHVSADRLCRWLRSNYKLRPDADGLLGRNELKLKLKRKAKRAKLMGSANDDTGDDGVRTGWVCVDVGVVEGGSEAVPDAPRHENFVGFGRRTDGVRIVVQMLTEEKREEIELEKLWGGILKRAVQHELDNPNVEIEPPQTSAVQPELPVALERPRESLGAIFGKTQTRKLHTSARRMEVLAAPNQQAGFDIVAFEESLTREVESGNYETATKIMRGTLPLAGSFQQEKLKLFILGQLRTSLSQLPTEVASEKLGVGSSSQTAPYLTCWDEASSSFPNEFEAESRIWLACYARELGHEEYRRSTLFKIFEDLQEYGVKISSVSYLRLLMGILRQDKGESYYHGPTQVAAGMSASILQAMYESGIDIIDEKILVNIQEVVTPEMPREVASERIYMDLSNTFGLHSLPMSPMQHRIHALMMSLDLPLFQDVSRMRLMDLYARNGHWKAFFEIFRMAPRKGKPQSTNVYAFMFRSVAKTGCQKACLAVLRTWIPDLEAEKPEIKLDGDIGEAVKACLRVSDPTIEQDAIGLPDMKGELLNLWRRVG
ncbi:uncharacterized protein L3040_004925 [Drepanopeziza brunnea f. sp. 'multigermtubi']|uniref:ATPase synthesis protein 25 n=1 Tax=Marssonina brunnea f. sp. multigermtubi (strain MB_m1) TaxID=1072389 RepID=K1X9N7_MARBU|nr:uncharacterized protein MBM_00815 [Drepanopeziza brunnea f. sp. 'multigermtubi' MB_m1]EKD21702.1 hypothetical protein MBM_00815 [Drepanopeziza brunnea f. sp. 'multigermtubi' MB_m1]KAJ5042376.1 hypothetical protein L3040_004925 [Drepanopeziza brunnea f. sp. 'multigermtubi']